MKLRILFYGEVEMAEDKKHHKGYEWPPEEAREHMRAARSEMRESWKSLFPPEFIDRRRAARKEVLLAARALIDHALERL
jgi:hypothetical protein